MLDDKVALVSTVPFLWKGSGRNEGRDPTTCWSQLYWREHQVPLSPSLAALAGDRLLVSLILQTRGHWVKGSWVHLPCSGDCQEEASWMLQCCMDERAGSMARETQSFQRIMSTAFLVSTELQDDLEDRDVNSFHGPTPEPLDPSGAPFPAPFTLFSPVTSGSQ